MFNELNFVKDEISNIPEIRDQKHRVLGKDQLKDFIYRTRSAAALIFQEKEIILFVFLQLIDASAVNTLVECIIRNTPILINPIEPVVEFLGEDYPFYYKNFYEANNKSSNIKFIEDSHNYLKNLSKDRFKIESFLDQMNKLILS